MAPALYEAIRLDRPQALRVLLQGGELPAMPERLHMSKVTGYLDYARFLKKPRSAADGGAGSTGHCRAHTGRTAARGFWVRLFGRN